MSRYYSYINSATSILELYRGDQPFSIFIKNFFAEHKKFGSKDRKLITDLCYSYFRLGKMSLDLPIDERMLVGLFLSSKKSNEIIEALKPEWNGFIGLAIDEKLLMLSQSFNTSLLDVFPWREDLSTGIDHKKFCQSFFIQPDLFIRIRPHHVKQVLLKLGKINVHYEFISPFTIRLPNSFKIQDHFVIDKEVVIQDYSSQQVAQMIPIDHNKAVRVWDCCAASGGKSIMAYDLNSKIDLTVSDIRESILINLQKRFQHAGITKYKSKVINLTSDQGTTTHNYDLIIADVPCTGSGTWSRTPEQLFYFEENKIDEYASRQKRIIRNVLPSLKKGGHLLYITCSVFKKENEENVAFIKENFGLELNRLELFKGYDKKADTIFAALFLKPL